MSQDAHSGADRTGDGKLRIGVMSFAHTHAQGYASVLLQRPDVEVLTSDPLVGERPAGETGGAELARRIGADYVDSYEELLAWHPHAVVICSENSRHRVDVELAAGAGAHILCEKPLATSLDDGAAMIAACDDAAVRLMMAYPVRYAPGFAALKAAYDSGRLGTLRGLHGANNGSVPAGARAWFVDPELAGGGALIDHVVHLADLYDELLGHQQAESVYAAANGLIPGAEATGVETAAQVSVRYPGGVVATIDSSWLMPQHAPTWGGLTLDAVGDAGFASMDAFGQRVDGFSELERAPLWLSYGYNLNAIMMDTFLDVVRTGAEPPVDGRGGYRTLAVALAALESARTGRPVDLDPLVER